MTLKLKTTGTRAVFEFEEGGMTASWTLLSKDSGPDLVGKLERMLAFLRREKLGASAEPAIPPAPAQWQMPPLVRHDVLPAAPVGAASGAGTLMQQGLQASRAFTGVAPVQPVPLQDSVAKAAASGWELYTGNDDE